MSSTIELESEDRLLALYRRWEELTHRERESILAEAWGNLQTFQAEKYKLQNQIIQVTDRIERPFDESGPLREYWRNLRCVIAELIQLETRNGELVDSRKRSAQAELLELESSSKTLKRLHRSYASKGGENWTSYG